MQRMFSSIDLEDKLEIEKADHDTIGAEVKEMTRDLKAFTKVIRETPSNEEKLTDWYCF